ncbi:MAG: hypothetical protein ACPK7O_01875 [Methanobacterium sp.]
MESLNLTPAESLIIISPGSNGNEMIKITLMDLLLKRALRIYKEERKSQFLKKQHQITFISKGESENLILKPHEQVLMEIVNKHELELKEFVKLLFNRINSNDYKSKYVRAPLIDKGYFRRQRKMLLALVPYDAYVLTPKGEEIKSKIMQIFKDAEYLQKWMMEDMGRAKAYLSVMGSHILLLDIYDVEDIKKFNRILSTFKPNAKTSDYYTYYLYSIPTEHTDKYGNLKNFDFIDMSLLDRFDSFNDFFSVFDVNYNEKSID